MAESTSVSSSFEEPIKITEPNLLIVEGKDEKKFFDALIDKLGISRIQVIPYGGKNKLGDGLKTIRDRTTFFAAINSLGIVRDADDDPDAAFQSVCHALRSYQLPVPRAPEQIAGGQPKVQVLILPGAGNPGMLEDICLQAVADQIQMDCVKEFFTCLKKKEEKDWPNSGPRSKAELQVYLASLEPGIQLGIASEKGFWPWDKPAFHSIKSFLLQLAG